MFCLYPVLTKYSFETANTDFSASFTWNLFRNTLSLLLSGLWDYKKDMAYIMKNFNIMTGNMCKN